MQTPPAPNLALTVLSLRYSSWSMRPWLALTHAGIAFETRTADVTVGHQAPADNTTRGGPEPSAELAKRRQLGSVTGLFPVLWVDNAPVHESLAICEWANEAAPDRELWPADPLARAQARSISCEMATGFLHLRQHLSCHPFARVPSFQPDAATKRDIDRVKEIWTACLQRSGGPFLFGHATIADFMYFPVVTRFKTYAVSLADDLARYSQSMYALPAVAAWRQLALESPHLPVYDQYVTSLGGDPTAGESEA